MYMHTSRDTPAAVAPTGLEAATPAYARIIDEVNKLGLSDMQRPPQPYTARFDVMSCPAWVRDSTAACLENSQRACAITAAGCRSFYEASVAHGQRVARTIPVLLGVRRRVERPRTAGLPITGGPGRSDLGVGRGKA